jgi:hypothetical protein
MKLNQHKLKAQTTTGKLFTCFTIFPALPIPSFSHGAANRNFCLQYKTMSNQNHSL